MLERYWAVAQVHSKVSREVQLHPKISSESRTSNWLTQLRCSTLGFKLLAGASLIYIADFTHGNCKLTSQRPKKKTSLFVLSVYTQAFLGPDRRHFLLHLSRKNASRFIGHYTLPRLWGRSSWVWLMKSWLNSAGAAAWPPPAPSQPPARWGPAAAPPAGRSCTLDSPGEREKKHRLSCDPRSCETLVRKCFWYVNEWGRQHLCNY